MELTRHVEGSELRRMHQVTEDGHGGQATMYGDGWAPVFILTASWQNSDAHGWWRSGGLGHAPKQGLEGEDRGLFVVDLDAVVVVNFCGVVGAGRPNATCGEWLDTEQDKVNTHKRLKRMPYFNGTMWNMCIFSEKASFSSSNNKQTFNLKKIKFSIHKKKNVSVLLPLSWLETV